MVRPLRPEASVWSIFVSTAIGFTAVVFFGRAGELVRPYLISVKERLPFSSQMAAWLLERILDLMMVLIIFGMSLSQVSRTGLKPGPHLQALLEIGGVIIGVAGAGCLGLLLLFRHFSESMNERLLSAITFLPEKLQERIRTMLSAFTQGFGSTRSGSVITLLLAYSVLEWLLIIACFISIFKAFPATEHLTLTDILTSIGFISLGAAVQIPGVGGGIQIAAVVVLTELFGLKLEVASGWAIALWLVTFVVIVPPGLILAFKEGLNWRSLSHLPEEVQP